MASIDIIFRKDKISKQLINQKQIAPLHIRTHKDITKTELLLFLDTLHRVKQEVN